MKYFVKEGDTLLRATAVFGRLEVWQHDAWAPFPTSRVDIWDDLSLLTHAQAEKMAGRAVSFYEGQPRAQGGKFGSGKLPAVAKETAGAKGLPGMMAQIAKPDGGFTYHAVTGNQPTTGYALSIYKGRESVLDAKTMTPTDLVKFASANRDLLSQRDNYFGAWHNPSDGKVYLDVSKVVSSAAKAETLGRANNQLAYFDLAGGKSVEIPGSQKHRE